MRRVRNGFLILLLGAPAVQADDKPTDKPVTPAEQYKALQAEYQAAQKAYQEALRNAKSPEDRQKVFQEKYPKPDQFARRFLELAEREPKDPAALDALIWVVEHPSRNDQANGNPRIRALEILARDHIGSEKLAGVCRQVGFTTDNAAEQFLRSVLEKSPHRQVQGQTCMALARLLKERNGADKEAEQHFERAADKYADLECPGPIGGQTIRDVANRELFEMRRLAVGKPVPEIEGEDLDGKKFKLRAYPNNSIRL